MNNSEEYLNGENIDKYCEALSEELLKANLGEHTHMVSSYLLYIGRSYG